jgi:hypothetical protein
MDRDERTLRQIIAALAALAVHAERSAARAFLVRCFVLALLRRAEDVLCRYVADVTGIDEPFFEDEAQPGSDPADAAGLAWRLRWLAAFLGALLDDACALHAWTPALQGPRRPRASHPPVGTLSVALGCGAFQPYDTS